MKWMVGCICPKHGIVQLHRQFLPQSLTLSISTSSLSSATRLSRSLTWSHLIQLLSVLPFESSTRLWHTLQTKTWTLRAFVGAPSGLPHPFWCAQWKKLLSDWTAYLSSVGKGDDYRDNCLSWQCLSALPAHPTCELPCCALADTPCSICHTPGCLCSWGWLIYG